MDEKCTQLWKKLSAALKPQVSADTFKRWFSAVKLIQATDDELTLLVPNNIYQFWIESNHMPALQAAIVTALGGPRAVKFSLPPTAGTDVETATEIAAEEDAQAEPPRDANNDSALGLNPRNTFESFVVGPNNEIAHAASLAVAQSPAQDLQPALHLWRRRAWQNASDAGDRPIPWRARKKHAAVMYLSSELFINEFIDAIQHNNLVKFRKRYRQADLLLIDDIHFLGGKERSQEEFFHTFNTLFDGHKQIVLSSDRPGLRDCQPRTSPRFPLRMGTDRGTAAARCRNAHGDPAQKSAHPADQTARRNF